MQFQKSREYKVKHRDDEDFITFINPKITHKKSFRFKKIFGEDATQEEIFQTVAKPMIKNFLSGYNGTIFTYGQTGSGKTYTMTGDTEEWSDPGLIPRTVQEIFKAKTKDTIVSITYCEIYNEHIYDLIKSDRPESDPAHTNFLTDANPGVTNFRYLSNHTVKSAEEALQLFLRGDSYKMVAETGSNVRSSRSHVIFCVALDSPHPTQENLRLKPVLYLVDLAGSEKLSKCKTPVSNLNETRYINLSLHYLEQVLVALRQPGRAHIPYRNSHMTALLKNSLGGNSITTMIATLSLSKEDAEETIQTCKFAERIALIKNDVKLSELISPEREIDYLKKENERLRAQLKLLSSDQVETAEELGEQDKKKCIEAVQNFIQDNEYFELPLTNVRRMEFCFGLMRDEILKEKDFSDAKDVKNKETQIAVLTSYKSIKNIQNVKSDDLQQKLKQAHETIFTKAFGKKKKSGELPRVNIIYKGSKWKVYSAGKENSEPRINKVNLSRTTFPEVKSSDFETLTVKYSNKSPRQSCSENKLRSNFFIENSKSSAKHIMDSRSGENYLNRNNTVSALSAAEVTVSSLTQVITDENSDNLEEGKIQLERKAFFENEYQNHPEEALQALNSASNEFKAFTAKCVPLTGDEEVDEEILKFYKCRYQIFKSN